MATLKCKPKTETFTSFDNGALLIENSELTDEQCDDLNSIASMARKEKDPLRKMLLKNQALEAYRNTTKDS